MNVCGASLQPQSAYKFPIGAPQVSFSKGDFFSAAKSHLVAGFIQLLSLILALNRYLIVRLKRKALMAVLQTFLIVVMARNVALLQCQNRSVLDNFLSGEC